MLEVVGENLAAEIIKKNPMVFFYPAEKKLTKYISTLVKIDEAIKQNPRLIEAYSINNNLEIYSSQFHLSDENTQENPFDIFKYKESLISKSGFSEYASVIYALTQGKNLQYKGKNTIPRRHFFHNSQGKASFSANEFDEAFEILIKEQVIIKNGKETYSFNHDVENIKNPFLAEYMRMVFYQDQKLARKLIN